LILLSTLLDIGLTSVKLEPAFFGGYSESKTDTKE